MQTKTKTSPTLDTYRIYYANRPGFSEQRFNSDEAAFIAAAEFVDSGTTRIDKQVDGVWYSWSIDKQMWLVVAQPLRWTKELPQTTGYYFRRSKDNLNEGKWYDEAVYVRDYAGSLAVGNQPIAGWPSGHHQWAGPIAEPIEDLGAVG